jgi:hypothetical protein
LKKFTIDNLRTASVPAATTAATITTGTNAKRGYFDEIY